MTRPRPGRTDFQGPNDDPAEPTQELDLFHEAASPTSDDEYLRRNNLGLGNYDAREYWQQIEAFKNHIYADAALGGTLLEFAIYKTKWELGMEFLAESDADDAMQALEDSHATSHAECRREAILALGEWKWDRLGRDEVSLDNWKSFDVADRQELTAQMQLQALDEYANGAHEWTTPQGRMISARHEASRSRGARLLDNLFGRVKEVNQTDEISQDELENGGGLL